MSVAARVAEESYQEGVALQADWLAAQEREVLAEVTRVADYYRARIEAVQLARALGLLPTTEAIVAWSAPLGSAPVSGEPEEMP